jgi:Dullard-like phosphatase family protein
MNQKVRTPANYGVISNSLDGTTAKKRSSDPFMFSGKKMGTIIKKIKTPSFTTSEEAHRRRSDLLLRKRDPTMNSIGDGSPNRIQGRHSGHGKVAASNLITSM